MVSDMLVYLILALVVLLGGIILSFKARDDLKAFSACLTLSVSFAISILEQKVNHKKCGSKEELRKKKQVMIKNGDH